MVQPYTENMPLDVEDLDVEEQQIKAEPFTIDNSFKVELGTYNTAVQIEEKLEVEYIYSHAFIALAIHIIHFLLGPISLPLLWGIFGKNLCMNMGFHFKRFRFYRNELAGWAWLLFTVIFLFSYLPEFNLFMSLILATKTIILIKTILVSVKYGFYTEKFWKMMKDQPIDMEILMSQLILIGWMNIPQQILIEELSKSFRRLNRPLDKLCISFKSPLPNAFKELIQRCNSTTSREDNHQTVVHNHKGKECIPTITLTKLIIEYAVPRAISKFQIKLFAWISLIYAASPIASMIVQYGSRSLILGPFEIIYCIYSLFLCKTISRIFLLYVFVGIIDMRRKLILMNQLSILVSKKESQQDSFLKEYNLPLIDFSDKRTIDSWYNMRTIFLDFGRRYTYRVFIYASLILPICIFLICILIVQFFIMATIISIPAMIAVIFLSFTCLALILYMIIIGSRVNNMFIVHKDMIVTINNDSFNLNELEGNADHSLYQSLKLVFSKLEQDQVLRPVKIMGLKADSQFLSKLFAILASGIVSLLQVVLKSDDSSNTASENN